MFAALNQLNSTPTKNTHPQHDKQRGHDSDTDQELSDGSTSRNSSNENSDERRPTNPPAPIKNGPTGWTIFYWGWWISWTPFVGIFIARISRGRTIREFLIGVTVVPTLFVVLWMSVFGGSAIELIQGGEQAFGEAVASDQPLGLFLFLDYM